MQAIADYFSNIPDSHRTLILVGGLLFFYVLEYGIPYIRFKYNKVRHAGINIFFTITTAIVNLLLAFLIVITSDWTTKNQFGVLYLFEMPLWLFTIVGFLLLDLIGAWLIHYLQHKIKWMWKFHLIHHADTYVDATTANRHHPGESVFRFIFTVIAVYNGSTNMARIFLSVNIRCICAI